MIGILSYGIRQIPHLASLLGEPYARIGAGGRVHAGIHAIAGWGRRPTSEKAPELARRHALPYIALEDGFLRSIRPGSSERPLSMIRDRVGIYYDASGASALEALIARGGQDAPLLAQARRGMAGIRRHRLSKYNHAPVLTLPAAPGRQRVLVVDQTRGDMSVVLGGADASTFAAMLTAALVEHPCAEVWVKAHPDVIGGQKQRYLTGAPDSARVHWLTQDCCPLSLIQQFDHIYVVTSQMGFEALLLGKPVTCFGLPWYAGWGLTDDRHPGIGQLRARRPGRRTLEQLFGAAYLQYTRYIDPSTGAPGTLFDVIDWLARNKRLNEESRGTLYCVGMSLWKRAIVRPFLSAPSNRLVFARALDARRLRALPADARIVVWGSQQPALRAAAREAGIPVVRLEDGFVRSVGLGSDLQCPLSLAFDGAGMHYDPWSGSLLETMLATMDVDDEAKRRATRIRDALRQQRISKYNVGGDFALAQGSASRRVLLVPGQVEGDAALQHGSPRMRRNRDLLEAVRAANPEAWIVYKPHPDVVAGNRTGAMESATLAALADQVVPHANITACIELADEVHTMTSLTGFEALLLDKQTHCYGAPFYAGWGLTTDHVALPHRRRRLSMDELVFIALCCYPRYRLAGSDGFCGIEDVVGRLADIRRTDPGDVGSRWVGRQYRKASALLRALI